MHFFAVFLPQEPTPFSYSQGTDCSRAWRFGAQDQLWAEMCISSSNWRSTRWMIHSCPHHRLLSVFRKMKSFLGKKKSNCTSTSSFNIFKLFFHSCWKLDVLRIGLKTRLKKEHANTFAHHEQLLRYFHAFFCCCLFSYRKHTEKSF